MTRTQHLEQLVTYAKKRRKETFILGMASLLITGTWFRTTELSESFLFSFGFLGVVPLLVREWRLGTIRQSFHTDAVSRRLIRFSFYLTTAGLLAFLCLLFSVGTQLSGILFLIPLGVLVLLVVGLQRLLDWVLVRREPDYITDRELHRELK